MEYQTWTRKANAVAAVEKLLKSMEIDPDILITGIEGVEAGDDFVAVVHAELAKGATIATDELYSFECALAPKARLEITHPEPEPEEKPKRLSKAEAKHLFTKVPHETKAGQRRLTCVGKNPFKRGASYDAWEWMAANPGATYAECKAAGCRMRAVSHCIKVGWVRLD